jgi:biopolymer transport protein ExbB/TolQ
MFGTITNACRSILAISMLQHAVRQGGRTMAEMRNHLDSLKSKMEKKESELSRLKLAIEAEEKRVKEKNRKENEKWWRDVSRQMEKRLIDLYGTEYKEVVLQSDLVEAVGWMADGHKDEAEEEEELYE